MESEQQKVAIPVTDLAFAYFAAHENEETKDPSFEPLEFAVLESQEKIEVSEDVAKYAFWMARKYGGRFNDRRYDLGHAVGSSIRMACVPLGIYPG